MNSGIFSNAPYLYAWMIYSEVWWKEDRGKGEINKEGNVRAGDPVKVSAVKSQRGIDLHLSGSSGKT